MSTVKYEGLELTRSAGSDAMVIPLLSILVPFYSYDPSILLHDIVKKMKANSSHIELVLMDDGSPSRASYESLRQQAFCLNVPVLVARSNKNLGRSRGRNLLVALARASHLVFLDGDMLPDRADYLDIYLAKIRSGVGFAYGGRSVARCVAVPPEHRLHWYFTRCFESVPPAVRAHHPAFYFLSSNFLVRRDIIEQIPLDLRFIGWGWEDCEWAHRVIAQQPLEHIDNSASHLGLITVSDIKMKYKESTLNFALILELCPELVCGSLLYRAAVVMRRWRFSLVVEALTEGFLDSNILPLRAKARLLQLYKAALYSAVVTN